MGLSIDSTRFLARAWKSGVRMERILTLGRQHLMLSPERTAQILEEFGSISATDKSNILTELKNAEWRFEILAKAFGAVAVDSCDASAYEGATIRHDLNFPIPKEWEGTYDLVLDGGTLEHVFNFPTAISNCMRWVKQGGHVMLFTPTNNYCGHGFYQFSPELFFRVFSPENGFRVVEMVALEDNMGLASFFGVSYPFRQAGPWRRVRDPQELGDRVTLINRRSAILMVLARKEEVKAVFQTPPQQSDYVQHWQMGQSYKPTEEKSGSKSRSAFVRKFFSEHFCREWLPRLVLLLDPFRTWRFYRKNSLNNRKFFSALLKK